MKGSVILFRGDGNAARRYLEADRSQADDYYLEGGTALASFTISDASGAVLAEAGLDPEQYAGWVDWAHPLTGEQMGTPRLPGDGRQGSPRFAEMVVNTPKSLSVAAALHPDVSAALDAAQDEAVGEIRRWLAQHSVTRVGPRGGQEVVPVEQLQTVAVVHHTSRAGDPHRHVHFQIGTRVQACAQVERNLARLEAEWEQAHPGETPGPVVRSRMLGKAWAYERPNKKPSILASEEAWRGELAEAGYDPATLPRRPVSAPLSLDDLRVQEVASRALDRCAAGASAWTRHTVQEHVTRVTTEHGVRATPEQLRDFIEVTTRLAMEDCFSILPPGAPAPDHVAHLTSLRVVAAESNLRDLLTTRVPEHEPHRPDVTDLATAHGLDDEQTTAAAAVASTDPLVIVEGAAGAGKTTMLSIAIEAAEREGRRVRVLAPTKKAAEVHTPSLASRPIPSRRSSTPTAGDGTLTGYGPASHQATRTRTPGTVTTGRPRTRRWHRASGSWWTRPE